jgi:hypothetical protein
MPLFRWPDPLTAPRPISLAQAASRLSQEAKTARRARKSARIAEHLKLLRADIDARLIADGAQPREWKHGR